MPTKTSSPYTYTGRRYTEREKFVPFFPICTVEEKKKRLKLQAKKNSKKI